MLTQIIGLLVLEQRVSYQVLKRRFDLGGVPRRCESRNHRGASVGDRPGWPRRRNAASGLHRLDIWDPPESDPALSLWRLWFHAQVLSEEPLDLFFSLRCRFRVTPTRMPIIGA